MSEPKQRWEELEAADLRGWSSLPVSALLLSRLEEQRDFHLWEVAKAVVRGDEALARAEAGGLFAVVKLLSDLSPPERPRPPEEEEFIDPASIRRKVKGPPTQTTTLETDK